LAATLEKIDRFLTIGDFENRVADFAVGNRVAHKQTAIGIIIHEQNSDRARMAAIGSGRLRGNRRTRMKRLLRQKVCR
jgi:hypothetical protein